MRGARGVTIDDAAGSLRENPRTARVVEVDMGHENGPKIPKLEASLLYATLDGVHRACGARVEEYEATIDRRQERRNQLGGS
jgi:hypothetical protein